MDITMGYKNIERTDQINGRETIDSNDLVVYGIGIFTVGYSPEMKII